MADPNQYQGQPANRRRDDFSNIFGAPPPPQGRSHTMVNPPEHHPAPRSQTMTGQWTGHAPNIQAPPQEQSQHSMPHPPKQYYSHQNLSQAPGQPQHGPPPHMQQYPYQQQQQQQLHPPGQEQNRWPSGSYMPFPGPGEQHFQRTPQPQPHHLPPPIRGDNRLNGPQRVDANYRSHTMAAHSRPQMYQNYPQSQPGGGPPRYANFSNPLAAAQASQYPPQQYQQSQAPLSQMSSNSAAGPNSSADTSNVPYQIPSSHVFRQPARNHSGSTGQSGQPTNLAGARSSDGSSITYTQPLDGRSMSMSVASTRQSGDMASMRSSIGKEIPSARSSISKDMTASRAGKDPLPQRSSIGRESSRNSAGKMLIGKAPQVTNQRGISSTKETAIAILKGPPIKPAYLSSVAKAFVEHIHLSDKVKDGLTYKDAFSGREAVMLLGLISKTHDQKIAHLLGRALDAQKLFHEVTYTHRLRDSATEFYQLRQPPEEVNGIFTYMAECYSPTCTPFRLCYSISCPRRLEQQVRLKMKLRPGLKRQDSRASIPEDNNEEQRLWINTVPKAVADSISEKEKKRQEIISELIYTERDFVKDLEYLRDFWIGPLRSSNDILPEARRKKVIRQIFSNCMEVHEVNSELADALTKRQRQSHVVNNVGDIFLDFVPRFTPFVTYGSQQIFGKHEFENEKRDNPLFRNFVEVTEHKKESRKLELNGYLTKPTTRLARYPLLLEGILKNTAPESTDATKLPAAITMIRAVLSQVNEASGKAENRFSLDRLEEQLQFREKEFVDLKLRDHDRQLLLRGAMKKTASDPSSDLQAFLFDHSILIVREKVIAGKKDMLKLYRRPIPLELLSMPPVETKPASFPLTFKHLGRGGFELTLYCSSSAQQKNWIDKIAEQQKRLRDRSNFYKQKPICTGYFGPSSRVNCCAPISGTKILLGGEQGTYILDYSIPEGSNAVPVPVFDYKAVTQVDVLNTHNIVLILTDRTLYFNTVEALADPNQSPTSRSSKIAPVNFFKTGYCNGEYLVSCARSSALSTTVKVYKPVKPGQRSNRNRGLSRVFGSKHEPLQSYQLFYIPSDSISLHYLRSKICVGCARGFEVVTFEPNIETQSLLDQADTSLDFVRKRENLRPIYIERIDNTFLLCYSEFSFFVDRNGWRARTEFFISWEGNPVAFAVVNGYILAFEPSFIEIRDLESGALMSVITAKNIRMLHSSKEIILYAYEDADGNDVISMLDLWVSSTETERVTEVPDAPASASAALHPPPSIQIHGDQGAPTRTF